MEAFVKLVLDNGVLVVIAGMVLYFGFKLADIFIRRLEGGKETNLQAHPLFSYLDSSLTRYIDTIEFSSKDKKVFLHILLKEKFTTFSRNFREFLRKDLEKLSKDELETENINILNKATKEYEDALEKMGYPKILLDKFKIWHEPHVRGVVDGIIAISSSNYYNDNITRQASIFYSYFTGFHSTIVDAKNTLNALNGEFTMWLNDNQETVEKIKNTYNGKS